MEAAESLFQCLEQVADPRKARGVRHPFQAILRLTLLGLVCGQTTMAHIALLARLHWPALKEPLGFVWDQPPHATTISRTLAVVPSVMVNVLAHDLKLCLSQWPASEKRYEPGVLREQLGALFERYPGLGLLAMDTLYAEPDLC